MSDKEDLEDGEIDTEEEAGDDDETNEHASLSAADRNDFPSPEKNSTPNLADAPTPKKSATKEPVEDDWAVNVEKAIANALIKDGVEPPLPKITKKAQLDEPKQQNRSRRRKKPKSERKRNKRLREEQDQATKQQHQQQQQQHQPNEEIEQQNNMPISQQQVLESQMEEMDIDEYEMLGMRGGSPPPVVSDVGVSLPLPGDTYESNGSRSGTESYESGDNRLEERRKRRRERSREAEKRQDNKRRRNDRSRDRRDRDRRDRKLERERDRERDRDQRDRDRDHRQRDRDDRVSNFILLF